MTSIEKLAKMFNDRDNQYNVNITTGLVVSEEPLRVAWGDSIILERSDVIMANTVASSTFKKGERVIIIPDNDFKNWYLIDKVG